MCRPRCDGGPATTSRRPDVHLQRTPYTTYSIGHSEVFAISVDDTAVPCLSFLFLPSGWVDCPCRFSFPLKQQVLQYHIHTYFHEKKNIEKKKETKRKRYREPFLREMVRHTRTEGRIRRYLVNDGKRRRAASRG